MLSHNDPLTMNVANVFKLFQYHIVWIPKYRKKRLYGIIKKQLVPVIRELARQKESEIVEGQWWVTMCIW